MDVSLASTGKGKFQHRDFADYTIEAGPRSVNPMSESGVTAEDAGGDPSWWREEVDGGRCTWLAVYAMFLSGYTSCVSFSVRLASPYLAEYVLIIRRAMSGAVSKRESGSYPLV